VDAKDDGASTLETLEWVTVAVIVVNTVAVGWSFADRAHEAQIEIVHNAILAFFVAELAVRLRAVAWNPRTFASSAWNCFDTAVIALSLLPVFPVSVSVLRIARLARVVHTLRHVSHLRLLDVIRRIWRWWR
jgi:voltage-gated sodium channel